MLPFPRPLVAEDLVKEFVVYSAHVSEPNEV